MKIYKSLSEYFSIHFPHHSFLTEKWQLVKHQHNHFGHGFLLKSDKKSHLLLQHPTLKVPKEENILDFSLGRNHLLYRTSNGIYWHGSSPLGSGLNQFGTFSVTIPTKADYSEALLYSGLDHSIIRINNSLYASGWQADGQTGCNGPYFQKDKVLFQQIPLESERQILNISTKADHSVLLTSKSLFTKNGTMIDHSSDLLLGWGNNEHQQLTSEKIDHYNRPIKLSMPFDHSSIRGLHTGGTFTLVNTLNHLYFRGQLPYLNPSIPDVHLIEVPSTVLKDYWTQLKLNTKMIICSVHAIIVRHQNSYYQLGYRDEDKKKVYMTKLYQIRANPSLILLDSLGNIEIIL